MITHKHTSKCIYLCYFPLTAQAERAVLPSMGCRGMSSLKGCGFLKTFWSQIESGHFGLKLGIGFALQS